MKWWLHPFFLNKIQYSLDCNELLHKTFPNLEGLIMYGNINLGDGMHHVLSRLSEWNAGEYTRRENLVVDISGVFRQIPSRIYIYLPFADLE